MKTQLPLLPGETPMPKAPQVELDDGTNCIPQHYLSYHHTRDSVEEIVADISYDPSYLLFVDDSKGDIFIQAGIIGLDNYVAKSEQACKKIVYGRRWRVEPQLPSSEIIQTAYLALLKAREHEVRELVKFHENGKITTPFSCHHDLPLMAMSRKTNTGDDDDRLSISQLQEVIAKLDYDNGKFALNNLLPLANDQQLVVLDFMPSVSTQLPELKTLQQLNIICESRTENAFLFSFMDALLHISQRHVEENFEFKGFKRFSRSNSVKKISELSAQTRHKGLTEDDQEFAIAFKKNNYETDETRVPNFPKSKLGEKLIKQLKQFNIGSGILPK
jgi:hypothetical protein